MLIRQKKHRKYYSPKVVTAACDTQSNFCQSQVFSVQVDEFFRSNSVEATESQEPLYFEF